MAVKYILTYSFNKQLFRKTIIHGLLQNLFQESNTS